MTHPLRPFSRPSGIIYGPVSSRRFGTSLGINVFPGTKKACSYECPYCQLGFAQKSVDNSFSESILAAPEEIESETRRAIESFSLSGKRIDCLTFSGNGEPTLHPRFPEIAAGVRKVRNELTPASRIVVLTNGAHLDRDDLLAALNDCDETVVKLDAGTEEMFRRINAPRRGIHLSQVVTDIRKLKNVTIQAMFVSGGIDNTSDGEIDAWLGHLKSIGPRAIQIYTLDRVPADSSLQPVPPERLRQIGRKVRDACDLEPQLIVPA
jgi:wyosine [tRNA(Phe)-imidazoG37] synthetase (radical SAM superfamily)